MGVKEEIIERFFLKLEEDHVLPDATIRRLKELWIEGKLASKAKIRDAVDEGITDANEN